MIQCCKVKYFNHNTLSRTACDKKIPRPVNDEVS